MNAKKKDIGRSDSHRKSNNIQPNFKARSSEKIKIELLTLSK